MTRTMAGYVVEQNGRDGLTPRSLVVTTDLLVVAFSDNLSAENSKLSADSGIQGIQLLECMDLWSNVPMDLWSNVPMDQCTNALWVKPC